MADPTNGNPVTPQPNPQMNAAPPDVGTPGAPDTSTAIGQQPPPAAPAGTQPNTDPNAVPGSVEAKHGVLASVFQDIAGGKKTTWRQTDQGPVAVKENLQPGEIARNILAAALTGLAGGYSPAVRGKGAGAAAAAGFEANDQRVEQQKKQAQDQAQEQFKNKNVADEVTLRKAANAREQQHSINEAQEHAIHMQQ